MLKQTTSLFLAFAPVIATLPLESSAPSLGSVALLKTVQKMKEKGKVAKTSRIGWNVANVRQWLTEKGRRIVMFSGRPISFYEASNAPRSKPTNSKCSF
jgi:hypothetical protein